MSDEARVMLCVVAGVANLALGLKLGWEVIRFGFRSSIEWLFFAGAVAIVFGSFVMLGLAACS